MLYCKTCKEFTAKRLSAYKIYCPICGQRNKPTNKFITENGRNIKRGTLKTEFKKFLGKHAVLILSLSRKYPLVFERIDQDDLYQIGAITLWELQDKIDLNKNGAPTYIYNTLSGIMKTYIAHNASHFVYKKVHTFYNPKENVPLDNNPEEMEVVAMSGLNPEEQLLDDEYLYKLELQLQAVKSFKELLTTQELKIFNSMIWTNHPIAARLMAKKLKIHYVTLWRQKQDLIEEFKKFYNEFIPKESKIKLEDSNDTKHKKDPFNKWEQWAREGRPINNKHHRKLKNLWLKDWNLSLAKYPVRQLSFDQYREVIHGAKKKL